MSCIDGGSRSKLGSDAQHIMDLKLPTLILDISSASQVRIRFNILHEFGHVLSLNHEQQHPEYMQVMKEFLDEEKLLEQFKRDNPKLTKKDFELQNGPLPEGTFKKKWPYDPKSIMHYP